MIHQEFINHLKKVAEEAIGLSAMLLIGSCGRGTNGANSDIDVQLLVNESFDPHLFSTLLLREFASYGAIVHPCQMRNKLSIYFENYPKIELIICKEISELDRYFIGSKITDLSKSILFISPNEELPIKSHLRTLLRAEDPVIGPEEIEHIIERIVYEFEAASVMHRRSDGYQFYFFYSNALHYLVRLACLAHGNTQFNFLPKNFIIDCTREEQEQFRKLSGTIFLPKGNEVKRRFLDFFYPIVEKLAPEQLKPTQELCEMIYERDYFWNFRDLAKNISSVCPGCIYRSSALCLTKPDKALELLEKHHITTIIDLRATNKDKDEASSALFRKEESGEYDPKLLEGRTYVLADLDPWQKPESFHPSDYPCSTDAEIAYCFYVVGCKSKIYTIMKTIIEACGAVLIHCYAGKDRTGIVMAMLAWLSGANEEEIIRDYLASEQDVQIGLIRLAIAMIHEQGGIERYLSECGLTDKQIQLLKHKISHE